MPILMLATITEMFLISVNLIAAWQSITKASKLQTRRLKENIAGFSIIQLMLRSNESD